MGNCLSHHQRIERQASSTRVELTEANGVKLSTLQSELGDSPVFSIIDFENWGKTQAPGKVFKVKPTTVEEVQKVVKVAAKFNLKVSCLVGIARHIFICKKSKHHIIYVASTMAQSCQPAC